VHIHERFTGRGRAGAAILQHGHPAGRVLTTAAVVVFEHAPLKDVREAAPREARLLVAEAAEALEPELGVFAGADEFFDGGEFIHGESK
jgi:hypothetical protein